MTEAITVEGALIVGEGEVSKFEQAYEQTLGEALALPDNQVRRLNMEVTKGIPVVLGALPGIMAMRLTLIEHMPKFPLPNLDNLERYVYALGAAQWKCNAASTPPEPVAVLAEQCVQYVKVLKADCQALVARGVIDGKRLRDLKNTVGYSDTYGDLFTLTQIIKPNWPRIAGKTALTLEELNRIEVIGERLARAIGLRDHNAADVLAEATETRDRMYTLFFTSYNTIRRAVDYLLPEEVARIMPSVHGAGAPRKSTETKQPDQPAAAAAEPDTSTAAPAAGAPAATAPVKLGMPGGDPFAS